MLPLRCVGLLICCIRFRSNISSHKEFEKGEEPVREDPEISRRLKSPPIYAGTDSEERHVTKHTVHSATETRAGASNSNSMHLLPNL